MSDPWGTTVIGNRANKKTPTVVRSESELNKARRTGAAVTTDKKLSQLNKPTSGDHARIAKLDRENEVAPPPKIAPAVGKAIIQGRNDKGLTQKDLAQKINEAPRVLQDYESGKAIPSQIVLGKLERALEIKLRGADIGKKLEPKGKKKDEKKDDSSAPSGSK
ncbi:multiprotein-bridging factor 1 [Tulasnella sp. 424]|nr:multiprotein-bridging factor 1 [Tulasnella sp. 424]KAG8972293.1 multiprotein-bridging factor 1 [Tulasnella sp. 425]